ncbi:MAG: ankyrin repeat domain-containing protein [Verrucomicrobiales bacterium]
MTWMRSVAEPCRREFNGIENGRFNDTPLQVAARHGHLDVARPLLEHRANVNHVDNDRFSPVTAAAAGPHWEVLKLLAEWGGDFDNVDSTGVGRGLPHRPRPTARKHGPWSLKGSLESGAA